MILYHGSNKLFKSFDLSHASEGTGVKFGYGIYLTESEASAVHYSQPRNQGSSVDHYLYTIEIPDLVENNHLTSASPVSAEIVTLVSRTLNISIPADVCNKGKDFRKWVGCALIGATKAGFAEEKAAAELLNSLGVIYNVWPTAQTKPDGLKNICVFNPSNATILKVEHIEIYQKNGKNLLVEGSKTEIAL